MEIFIWCFGDCLYDWEAFYKIKKMFSLIPCE